MKVGDLVQLNRNRNVIGIIISALNGNGFFDVMRTDGVVLFTHISSMEVISENR